MEEDLDDTTGAPEAEPAKDTDVDIDKTDEEAEADTSASDTEEEDTETKDQKLIRQRVLKSQQKRIKEKLLNYKEVRAKLLGDVGNYEDAQIEEINFAENNTTEGELLDERKGFLLGNTTVYTQNVKDLEIHRNLIKKWEEIEVENKEELGKLETALQKIEEEEKNEGA